MGIGLRECRMMVGERRFELPTSESRTLRVVSACHLPPITARGVASTVTPRNHEVELQLWWQRVDLDH